jgi:hypothetical protein
MDKIIRYQVANKRETYSLKQFLNNYTSVKEEIKNLITA